MSYTYSVHLSLNDARGKSQGSRRIDVQANSAGEAADFALERYPYYNFAETTHVESARGDLRPLPVTHRKWNGPAPEGAR